MSTPFGRRLALVDGVKRHGTYVSLHAIDSEGPRPRAGQFYMIQTARAWGGGDDGRPYLPRALSFARVAPAENGVRISFLLESVGPGTQRLADCREGDELLLAGPFGNGFETGTIARRLLVAGGIGLAPIIALDDELRAAGDAPAAVLIGMRDEGRLRAAADYGLDYEAVTEDGSVGQRGYVTELLAAALREEASSLVFACGPPAMLEAVRGLCAENDTPVQLAMESGMACGFGACYGCVVPTLDGYVRLCVDGPVLRGEQIETALVAGAGH